MGCAGAHAKVHAVLQLIGASGQARRVAGLSRFRAELDEFQRDILIEADVQYGGQTA
jgi:hypothetical protein